MGGGASSFFKKNIEKSQSSKADNDQVFHKIDFTKQSPSIAMDLMYNQNAEKQP